MKRPFPMVSLLVEGKRCLLIGGQEAALSRADEFYEAGAMISIVARRASPELLNFVEKREITFSLRDFDKEDLSGAEVVINTSRDALFAQEVFTATRGMRCVLATLDDPARSDIGFVAVARSGLLRVGVSTGGASPALARRLREEMERIFSHPKTERLLRWMEQRREEWHKREPSFSVRAQALRDLLSGLSISGRLEYPTKFIEEDGDLE